MVFNLTYVQRIDRSKGVNHGVGHTPDDCSVNYETLLSDYTFANGSPCGKTIT